MFIFNLCRSVAYTTLFTFSNVVELNFSRFLINNEGWFRESCIIIC